MASEHSADLFEREFYQIASIISIPEEAVAEPVCRKVQDWYQNMLPFAARMSDHKFDDVTPFTMSFGR